MKTLNVEQGSPEWHNARKGIPTASQFSKILTASKLEISKSAEEYAAQLACERLDLDEEDFEPTDWMKRGLELEPDAALHYEAMTGRMTTEVGFCYPDDSTLYGCSPDRLVQGNGILEIKCPKASTMAIYLTTPDKVPSKYWLQVQAQLWITEADWCDFFAWHPETPSLLVRAFPCERTFDAFEQHIPQFVSMVEQYCQILTTMVTA